MENYIKECFNSKGRWNRKKFWLYLIPIYLVLILFILISLFLLPIDIAQLSFILIYVVMVYIGVLSYIKRLRDLNKNPWMILILFIPLIGLYIWIICAFIKGTTGINKYGPDPLGITQKIPLINQSKKEEKIVEL